MKNLITKVSICIISTTFGMVSDSALALNSSQSNIFPPKNNIANTQSKLMVGYLESWGDISINQAAQSGYNTIVLGFGTINGANVGIFDNSFTPDNINGQLDINKLKEDITNANKNGARVLLSFGGANNTYKPNNVNVNTLAQNMVNFAKSAGFQGFDFDLEINTDGTYLSNLITAIKKIDSSMIITCAPQVNGTNNDVQFVSTGMVTPYNIAISKNQFNYIFVQEYNTGSFTIQKSNETNVNFISNSFNTLANLLPKNSPTKIVPGEPATTAAAGSATVFHGNTPISQVYNAMASAYNKLNANPIFGGAMTWDINYDAGNNYQFVKTINPIINS